MLNKEVRRFSLQNMSRQSAQRKRSRLYRETGKLVDLPNLERSNTQRQIITTRSKNNSEPKISKISTVKPYARFDNSTKLKSVIFKG